MIAACGCAEVDSLEGWTLDRCDDHRGEPAGPWAEPAESSAELANRAHGWPRESPEPRIVRMIAANMDGAIYRTATDRYVEKIIPDPFQDAKREVGRAREKRKRLRQKAERIIPTGAE